LVDAIQLLVEKNHGVLLFPDWTNGSDYIDTPESFGTIALHNEELDAAVSAIAELESSHLTRDMRYLCQAQGTQLPFLPVHGREEFKLLGALTLKGSRDEQEMALKWCEWVDGKTIFPKLPVHLRTHKELWEKNERVRDALKRRRIAQNCWLS
jgi:hypothetical protein